MLINIKFVEMKDFNDYDILYPELIIDILKYFHVSNSINKKNIVDFCTTHSPQGRVSRQFLGWVFSLGESVRILGPEAVVDQMKAETQRLIGQYDIK